MRKVLQLIAAWSALLTGVMNCNAIAGIKEGAPRIAAEECNKACYTGEQGTEGVGACVAGARACDSEGNPTGACVGEVVPRAEQCGGDPAEDEDCDGAVNEEGADCACGDGFVSNDEPCDDGGTASGDGCSSTCEKEYVVEVVAGLDHTCVRLSSGAVKCWGQNDVGQLGLGDIKRRGDDADEMGPALPPVDLGSGEVATALAAGDGHTCALLEGGRVKCWGWNYYGQLGLGDNMDRGDDAGEMGDALAVVDLGEPAEALVAGGFHTCARFALGRLKCWGQNDDGELGLGDTSARGNEPSDMGDNLPFVNLGSGKAVTALAAGNSHTCALLDDGSVKCWGRNHRAQLGAGDSMTHGDAPNEMGAGLSPVNLGPGLTATAVYASDYTSCALLASGSLKCWGHNDDGQLAAGDIVRRGDTPNEMGDNLPLVALPPGQKVVTIVGGDGHVCALFESGRVKCWGWNAEGQLGLGDKDSRGDSSTELLPLLPNVEIGDDKTAKSLCAGGHSACVILNDDTVKCWGSNNYGALGLGDAMNRGDELHEMGDDLPVVQIF